MKPQRIQRKRTKGWRMPPNTVYVGRPTIFGNPFIVGTHGTAEECVKFYKRYMSDEMSKELTDWKNNLYDDKNLKYSPWYGFCVMAAGLVKGRLRGKNLACWCPPDQPCHADVLLELANS